MDIRYKDNWILVCIKPAGVLSTDEPGGLPSLLREALGDPTACVRTVHRLDRTVSGLMVLARTRMAASILSQQVRQREFGKEYLAVVHGELPQTGTLRDLLGRDPESHRTYVADAPGKDVREAVLDYEVLDRREGLSLVRVRLHTGRTHQIRVQFASRGFPLVGDRRYGDPEELDGIALWSWRLGFTHPKTGERVQFAQLPPQHGPWCHFPLSKMDIL